MSTDLLLESGEFLLLENGDNILLEQQEPETEQISVGGGYAWREWHKAHEKHVKRMWQEIAERESKEADELGAAYDRAQGIVEVAAKVLDLPKPEAIPEPILALAEAIQPKQTRERDRQSSRLLKLISELHQAIQEAEEDEEDVWLLLAA